MTLQSWLLFCATETVLCLNPGPAVLLVVSLTLTDRVRAGVLAGTGILAANALYFVISASSVGALLIASWELFFLIKWAGAAYLIWIGLVTLLASGDASVASAPLPRPFKSFLNGFVLQAANPKVLLYFTALLPQFIDPRADVAPQVLVLGVSSIVIEFIVLGGYALAAGRARRLAVGPRFVVAFRRAGGALLIGAGAGLATIRRTAP